MPLDQQEIRSRLLLVELDPGMEVAARNAVRTCLDGRREDRAVIIYDRSTVSIAAALMRAFDELGAEVSLFDFDSLGTRPINKLSATVTKTLEAATVSAMAVTSMRGELSARKSVLAIATQRGVRHAHMPSITPEVFVDGLAMDYREVSAFMKKLLAHIERSTSLVMTSAAGTHLEFTYPSPPVIDELDGLITPGRWQNLPSGQIIIYPSGAEGVYVADRSIGDWFEHEYDVAVHPVTMEFSKGTVRSISCDNKRLERDLWLFLRSSDNSGRISELIVGSNLGLTKDHSNALYNGYRPGASLSLGAFDYNEKLSWSSATVLPIMGKRSDIALRDRRLMTDDVFEEDLL